MITINFINLQQNIQYFALIKKSFTELIVPKYGIQEEALEKIQVGSDRQCEILLINDEPKGLIVYKTELQNEFGLNQAFELKTALLFDPIKHRGLGQFLFQRAENHAVKQKAKWIYGTMAEKNMQLLNHLQARRNWKILKKTKSEDNLIDVYVIFKELHA